MDNIYARVFDSTLTLRNHRGSDRVNVLALGYENPLDKGGGQFYWDDASVLKDDGVMCLKVANVATGRWIRVMTNNEVNVCWFGAKPNMYVVNNNPGNNPFDNSEPVARAIEFVKKNAKYRVLYFPAGEVNNGYFFSKPLEIRANIRLRGDESWGLFEHPTILVFYNTAGVRFLGGREWYYTALKNTSVEPVEAKASSDWSILPEDVYPYDTFAQYVDYEPGKAYTAGTKVKWRINASSESGFSSFTIDSLISTLYQEDGENHGFFTNTRTIINDVYVRNFKGDGFHINADALYVPGGTIANIGYVSRCAARYNSGDGFHIEGGDANAWHFDTLDATTNKYWGVYDGGLLSNVWINAHTNNNGIYTGSSCRVQYGDYVNVVAANGDILTYGSRIDNNVGHNPFDDNESKYWAFRGINGVGANLPVIPDIPIWSATESYEAVRFYQVASTSLNVPPLNHPNYTQIGVGDVIYAGLYEYWLPTKTFRSGGAMCSTRAVSNSVFIGCYSEMGQGHTILNGGAILFGGETGTPVRRGTVLYGGAGNLSVGNGAIASRNGLFSQDGQLAFSFETNGTNTGRDALRTSRSLEIVTGNDVTIGNYVGHPPQFVFNPNSGTSIFGGHIASGLGRFDFNAGDIGINEGRIVARIDNKRLVLTRGYGPLSERPANFGGETGYIGWEWFNTDAVPKADRITYWTGTQWI